MKLFSFPLASLEKAIHKRVLTLPSPHKEWFVERWAQKPYKKAFVENKAMPLVTLVAKGKTMDDALGEGVDELCKLGPGDNQIRRSGRCGGRGIDQR